MLGIIHTLRNLTFMPFAPSSIFRMENQFMIPKNDFFIYIIELGEQLLTIVLFNFEQRKNILSKWASDNCCHLQNTYTSFKHIDSVIHLNLYKKLEIA